MQKTKNMALKVEWQIAYEGPLRDQNGVAIGRETTFVASVKGGLLYRQLTIFTGSPPIESMTFVPA